MRLFCDVAICLVNGKIIERMSHYYNIKYIKLFFENSDLNRVRIIGNNKLNKIKFFFCKIGTPLACSDRTVI